MEEFCIDAGDYILSNPMTELPTTILTKLHGSKPLLASSYNIPKDKYKKVYTTSDIHADIHTFSKILFKTGLSTEDLQTDLSNLYSIRWNPRMTDTILVIVGDIVDGHRNGKSVSDPTGDIEIKLHILLYNLRLSARSYNSELRFIIGNHDFHTVIQDRQIDRDLNLPEPYNTITDPIELSLIRRSYYTNMDGFYEAYVHPAAKTLFGNRLNRRTCLLPFYECCPYLCVTIGNEIIFVHASLHGGPKGQYNLTPKLLEIQQQIESSSLTDSITGTNLSNIHFIAHINEANVTYGSVIWSRFYSIGTEDDVCSLLVETDYTMTIVGHCPTNMYGKIPGTHMHSILERPTYNDKGCKADGGCVLLGCNDNLNPRDKGPHIAFVDISMSRAFVNKGVREEILLLEHDESFQDTRFYNKISRINTAEDPNDIIVVWQSAVRGGKAAKHSKTKRRRKIRKRKSRRH